MTSPEQALQRRRPLTSRDRTDAERAAVDTTKQENEWIDTFMASLSGIIRQMR
jgi:hypothetical protein